jgi:hypothetical protein
MVAWRQRQYQQWRHVSVGMAKNRSSASVAAAAMAWRRVSSAKIWLAWQPEKLASMRRKRRKINGVMKYQRRGVMA